LAVTLILRSIKVGYLALITAALFANNLLARDDLILSDQAIRSALIGSWIVASDSADRTPENALAQQIFRADETYTTLVFADKLCGVIVREIKLRWVVNNGKLISIMPNGRVMEDEILNISNAKITLRSLDTGIVFMRERSHPCS
jgi:hypothetical protein